MTTDKFEYNDMVQGFIDGFGMRVGKIIDIDPDSKWPYMIKDSNGEYASFAEDELELWEEDNALN